MPLKGRGEGLGIVEPALRASTGTSELARRKCITPPLYGQWRTYQLHGGGIESGVVTLLYSASRRLPLLLQQLAVLVHLPNQIAG